MNKLTDPFLKSLVAQLDNENTVGVSLAGSYARGQAGPFSDVDIHHYVRKLPANANEAYTLRYIDGCLVSVTVLTLEDEQTSLQDPRKAIWSIPGLRQERILLDKIGSIAALKETALKTSWHDLQAAADRFASWNLSGCAEEVHKILAGLLQRDESMILHALWGLTDGLANCLLVQRGILIQSENAYLNLVQDAAGRKSAWTCQFRLAVGLDRLLPDFPAYIGRGTAGLRLYCETARLLQATLLPQDAEVISQTVKIISEAGYR